MDDLSRPKNPPPSIYSARSNNIGRDNEWGRRVRISANALTKLTKDSYCLHDISKILGIRQSTPPRWNLPVVKIPLPKGGPAHIVRTADLIEFLDRTGRIEWDSQSKENPSNHKVNGSRVKMLTEPAYRICKLAEILGVGRNAPRKNWKAVPRTSVMQGCVRTTIIKTADLLEFLERTNRIDWNV